MQQESVIHQKAAIQDQATCFSNLLMLQKWHDASLKICLEDWINLLNPQPGCEKESSGGA